MGGESLEGLGDEVRVRGHHLLPAGGLHHVRYVTVVDELNRLEGIFVKSTSIKKTFQIAPEK